MREIVRSTAAGALLAACIVCAVALPSLVVRPGANPVGAPVAVPPDHGRTSVYAARPAPDREQTRTRPMRSPSPPQRPVTSASAPAAPILTPETPVQPEQPEQPAPQEPAPEQPAPEQPTPSPEPAPQPAPEPEPAPEQAREVLVTTPEAPPPPQGRPVTDDDEKGRDEKGEKGEKPEKDGPPKDPPSHRRPQGGSTRD